MRRHWIPAAAVIAVAVTARLLVLVEIKDGPVPHMRVWTQSDMSFFDGWARAVAGGDVLTAGDMRPYHGRHRALACSALALTADASPCDDRAIRSTWDAWVGKATFWQDPGYPYALAVLYATVGDGVHVGYAFNVVMGLLVVAFVYRVAFVLGGVVAAVSAGLIAALYGPLVFYETLLLREVAITCAGLALVVLILRALERSGSLAWALCGLTAGVFVLLKASGLLFVVTVPAFIVIGSSARDRSTWRSLGAFGAGFAIALAPLVARNLAVDIAPLSVASTGPLNFLNGNAVDRVPGAGSAVSDLAAPILAGTGGDGPAMLRAAIASHPSVSSWLALLVAKAGVFWQAREIPNNASYDYFRLQAPLFARVSVGFTLLCALAVPGLVPAMRRRLSCAVVLAYVLAGIGVCVVFYNLSRFRLPIACAMMPLAGCGVAAWLAALRARRWAAASAGAIAAVAVAFSVAGSGDRAVVSTIRIADYGVANEISVHLARRALADGRPGDAAALLHRQLRTLPPELAAIEPDLATSPASQPARVTRRLSGIAGTFVKLHRVAAAAAASHGRAEEAERHRYRAFVLERINAPYAASTSAASDS